MSCDNFGNCYPDRIQPGFQQPGQIDPLRQEAFHIAAEMQHGMIPQAMQEIRQTVHNLPPHEAERFARDLQQATGGRSPLQERPEVVNTPNGPMQTGNDLLVMTDPYGRPEVVKQIRHEHVMVAPPIAQPGYQPGYPPAYVPENPAVNGLATGLGIAGGLAIGHAIFGGRR